MPPNETDWKFPVSSVCFKSLSCCCSVGGGLIQLSLRKLARIPLTHCANWRLFGLPHGKLQTHVRAQGHLHWCFQGICHRREPCVNSPLRHPITGFRSAAVLSFFLQRLLWKQMISYFLLIFLKKEGFVCGADLSMGRIIFIRKSSGAKNDSSKIKLQWNTSLGHYLFALWEPWLRSEQTQVVCCSFFSSFFSSYIKFRRDIQCNFSVRRMLLGN